MKINVNIYHITLEEENKLDTATSY